VKKHVGPKHTVMKSIFFGTVITIDDDRQAKDIVKQMKNRDRKARHVVHAFRIDGIPVIEGMSDDGEPHGTGGMPLLMLLRGMDITGILLTVTRYFGGVKLGPGNLKRAYRDAAKKALESMPDRK